MALRRESPAASIRGNRERFDTAVFTGLNIAIFLLLAASVVVAAVLYGQGA
jgi:hypothetical protein